MLYITYTLIVDKISKNFDRRLKLFNQLDFQTLKRSQLIRIFHAQYGKSPLAYLPLALQRLALYLYIYRPQYSLSLSSLYLKLFFYIYITTTASPELRLYKRGGSVIEPTTKASTGEPRALAYTLRTAYVSYAQVYHLLTPSTLTIDRATSCRLLKYIHSAAIDLVL